MSEEASNNSNSDNLSYEQFVVVAEDEWEIYNGDPRSRAKTIFTFHLGNLKWSCFVDPYYKEIQHGPEDEPYYPYHPVDEEHEEEGRLFHVKVDCVRSDSADESDQIHVEVLLCHEQFAIGFVPFEEMPRRHHIEGADPSFQYNYARDNDYSRYV